MIARRAEARNGVEPDSADGLVDALLEVEKNSEASIAAFWGSGCAPFAG